MSAVDDPMLPPEVLDEVRDAARMNPALHIEFVSRGGHAGFALALCHGVPFFMRNTGSVRFFAASFEQTAAQHVHKQGSGR